jgi:5-methylcytosine-specific restriction endonuclease McrA
LKNPKRNPNLKQARCVACGTINVDRCHIKSKGSGGSWDNDNIILLCRICHITSHQIGWPSFVIKYPNARIVLFDKGWHIENEFGVLKLKRIEDGKNE